MHRARVVIDYHKYIVINSSVQKRIQNREKSTSGDYFYLFELDIHVPRIAGLMSS